MVNCLLQIGHTSTGSIAMVVGSTAWVSFVIAFAVSNVVSDSFDKGDSGSGSFVKYYV